MEVTHLATTVRNIVGLACAGILILTSCTSPDQTQEQVAVPTNTLAVIVSMTPRFTATPVPSRTPLPTFTLTPSDTPVTPTPSNTPPPTATPPITGIVASLETVNVRNGPGVNYTAIVALTPGTGVQVIATSSDGRWLNIRMDDGREGWMAASLLRINPTPTVFPTATPSPDFTAIAQGTTLPTAVLGGGVITPTPPRSVVTPTTVDEEQPTSPPAVGAGTLPPLPVIDVNAIQLTATALALPSITPSFTPLPAESPTPTIQGVGVTFTPSAAGVGSEGTSNSQSGVDVLAYCDNKNFGRPAPNNLNAGATIDVFWSWYVSESALMQQHLDNVIYDVKVDGTPLENWRQFGTPMRKGNDGNYYIFWYVPFGPLASGQHTISYDVSWKAQITDGYDLFGPGTNRPSESGSCTFTVR
ncbi:MAG: SH3 domain-containing protein [Anaerolineae bacterium]